MTHCAGFKLRALHKHNRRPIQSVHETVCAAVSVRPASRHSVTVHTMMDLRCEALDYCAVSASLSAAAPAGV